jgi:uncharacterized membrane protein
MRRLFGPVFVATGILHFVLPGVYESIVPEYLPARRGLVYASGVAEIVGGLGAMSSRTRKLASWWNMATLVGVSPANVDMAVHAERWEHKVPGGRPALIARLPVQLLLIAWAWAAGR